MATQGRKARNSIDKTMTVSLAALTIGFAVLGAVVPSYADQNNYVSPSFPTDGVVRLGLSPAGSTARAYTAYYRPGNGETSRYILDIRIESAVLMDDEYAGKSIGVRWPHEVALDASVPP